MDRSADTIHFDFTDATINASRFLTLLAAAKGLDLNRVSIDATIRPVAVYRGVHVEGFWPIVMFLNDVRPHPELLPDTPERRALVTSFVDALVTDALAPEEFAMCYRGHSRFANRNARPSLLDLAIVAIKPDAPPPAWRRNLETNLARFITNSKVLAELESTDEDNASGSTQEVG